ncbi:MAG: rhodanese-like domain-containing protein [Bacteroidota bacterium]
MKFIAKVLFPICFVIFQGCMTKASPKVTTIDKVFLKTNAIGRKAQLIDVRTLEEYRAGHIDGAVNYDIRDKKTFLMQIENLDKERPVYLYCQLGGRSGRAAQVLKAEGFTKIFDYSAGYNDWETQK